MKKAIAFVCSLCIMAFAVAQQTAVQDYIDNYKGLAILEMKRTGVPASIKLAQGILETESGNSDLVRRSNNHFGIKCKSNWKGEFVFHDDDALGECFRKYGSAEESYADHSNFLKNSSRYAFLFNLQPTDYKGWAYGLKKAGYATNPKYPAILIRYIEQYNLNEYTLIALRQDEGDNENTSVSAQVDETLTDGSTADISNTNANRISASRNGKSLYNGLKAAWATAGTSLLAIATEHQIALIRLLEFNDLQHDGILNADEWIYLEKKRKTGLVDSYTTASDETVRAIAQLNGIQVNSLLEYNAFKHNQKIAAGTKVYLKPVQKNTAALLHEVQPKEGLYAIARKYQVTVDELKAVNNLESDKLSVGQTLIIKN